MVRWHALTEHTAHRPWPLPARPWVMTMSWCDLLFAHWELPAAQLRPLIPPGLALDTFEDRAFLGVVPFRMESVGPRGLGWLPGRLPGPRAFPELNVRLYVHRDGKPGVFFLSLDATSPLAVWGARRFFHLPYCHAEIALRQAGGWIRFRSLRRDPRLAAGAFLGRYRSRGERLEAPPGSLEHWLTERYCLYAVDHRGTVYRGDIHHLPWPLHAAEAELELHSVATAHGLPLDPQPSLLHFVHRIDVVAWGLETCPAGSTSESLR